MRDQLTKKLAAGGLLAAAIVLLTAVVSLPLPGGHGYINLGDAGVLLAAYALGGPWGALCGGAASALADILLGWSVYAPATLVIKGGEALLAGWLIGHVRGKKLSLAMTFPAALVVPAGYFLYEWLLYGAPAAALNVPLNLVQCLAGAAVAYALILVLRRAELPGMLQGAMTATGKIVREPKGGPDVVFYGHETDVERMLRAGDLLSVRGFTARIVRLDGTAGARELSDKAREQLLGNGVPAIDAAAQPDASAETLAEHAMQEVRK